MYTHISRVTKQSQKPSSFLQIHKCDFLIKFLYE